MVEGFEVTKESLALSPLPDETMDTNIRVGLRLRLRCPRDCNPLIPTHYEQNMTIRHSSASSADALKPVSAASASEPSISAVSSVSGLHTTQVVCYSSSHTTTASPAKMRHPRLVGCYSAARAA